MTGVNESNTSVIEEVLISEDDIKRRVKELAEAIDRDYKGRSLFLLSILSGSFIFMADIVRALTIPVNVNFIFASSYGSSTVSSGDVKILDGKGFDPSGKDILIVEDIIDTGRTLYALREKLLNSGAKSVEICTFLDKPSRRVVSVDARYIGFDIPDKFAVGYGLDYNDMYRQFPFVGVLKPELYQN